MSHPHDLRVARDNYFKRRPNNLFYLLKSRYAWMNDFIKDGDIVYELGAGAGFSKDFIKKGNFKLTDYKKQDWIDLEVDALKMPFKSASVDVLIISHVIHHLANPKTFFDEVARVLKSGGALLISEIKTSLVMRALLWFMQHESWSFNDNVFDGAKNLNNPDDPWTSNAAIPDLLFTDVKKFEEKMPAFEVVRAKPCEFLIFALSGGVTAKTFTIPFPLFVLRLFDLLDTLLVKLFPGVFGLAWQVVLKKK